VYSGISTPATHEVKLPPILMPQESKNNISARNVSKRRMVSKTQLSNYKTIDRSPMRNNKHYNPNPLVPVMNKNLMMQRHASTFISRNYTNATLPKRQYTSIV
jgi:hypothetical protein